MFFVRVGVIMALAGGVASADPVDTGPPSEHTGAAPSEHLVFIEFLGKGGLWGAGYEYRRGRWSVGGVASYYQLSGDRFTNISPYLGFDPVLGDRVKWFVHAGPQLVRRTTPSPGPEWKGMSDTGWAFEMSSGIDVRVVDKFHLRTYLLGSYGSHFAPGIGFSAGWAP